LVTRRLQQALGVYPLRTILSAMYAAIASNMHIIPTAPGVKYMLAIMEDSVHFGGSWAGSINTACVRIGMMQKIRAAVITERRPSFHHILPLLTS